MKTQIIILVLVGLTFQKLIAQKNHTNQMVRSTIGMSGSSEKIRISGETFIIQQSIGQASVIGSFYDSEYIARQGFIQPNILAKIINTAIPLNLDAIIYPNPFVESVTISFSEQITDKIDIAVFDVLGRLVFSKSLKADQKVKVQFNNLSVANYILKVTANNKQFIKKLIKK